MAWVYLDENFPDHPKVVAAGDEAAWLFVTGLAWCKRQGAEGRIPVGIVPRLTGLPDPAELAGRLVDAGLWHLEGDSCYVVNDWGDWNRSQESRSEAGRKAAKARWEKKRQTDASRNANASESHSDPHSDPHSESHDLGNATASETHMRNDAQSPPLPSHTDTPARQLTPPGPDAPAGAEDRRIAVAAARLAQRDLDAARARGERIARPGGFLEHRRRSWADGPDLAAAALEHPALDAAGLADLITTAHPAAPWAGEPETEAFVARAERNAARARGEACDTCDGTGMAEDPDGAYRSCPTCRSVA